MCHFCETTDSHVLNFRWFLDRCFPLVSKAGWIPCLPSSLLRQEFLRNTFECNTCWPVATSIVWWADHFFLLTFFLKCSRPIVLRYILILTWRAIFCNRRFNFILKYKSFLEVSVFAIGMFPGSMRSGDLVWKSPLFFIQ